MSKRYEQWGYESYRDNETGLVASNYIEVMNEQDQKIKELEHRLANCIEPKFKIGQEVWVVFSSIQRFPFKCKITDFRYVYSKRKFYYSGTGETSDYDFAEQIWCETEEEAKAKLEELQNG